MDVIGEADELCKNLNRIYYAGKNIVFDSGNVLNTDNLIELSKDIIIIDEKPVKKVESGKVGKRVNNILNNINNISSNILFTQNPPINQNDNNYYNIKAIKERNVEYLKNKINNSPIEFDNTAEFWYYIYHDINIANLLEINYPKSFRCLFHDDSNPSASIFQNNEGVWLYTCNSTSCRLTMNIKQLIEKIGNFKSEYKAIEFIKSIFNISIKETKWRIEQKANLDSILYKIDMNIFAELCPQTDKNIRYVKDLFSTFIHIAKDNLYGENYMNSDGDIVFFVSLTELAKIMKVSPTNINRLSQRIAVLVYHDLVRKLDDNKIPKVMLKKAQALMIARKTDKRINFYSIPSWVFQQLKNIEIQGCKWKKYGYTIKGTSYEMFYRAEGLEVAQHIYPQHKKVAVKKVDMSTGEITSDIRDRTTSKTSDERTDEISSIVNAIISNKNYVTEKEVVEILMRKYGKTRTEIQFKRSLQEILDKYNLQRLRANKIIKEQYKITGTGYPFIIVR